MKIPVYIGRGNAETLRLFMVAADGRELSVAAFLSSVTRIQLITRNGTIDSQTAPQALVIDAAAQTLTVTVGDQFSVAGLYPVQLVLFSTAYPDGYVWIDRHDAEPSRRLVLNVVAGS